MADQRVVTVLAVSQVHISDRRNLARNQLPGQDSNLEKQDQNLL
jgi:hypothetical protein